MSSSQWNLLAGPTKRGPDAGRAQLCRRPRHVYPVGSCTCTPPCCPSVLQEEKADRQRKMHWKTDILRRHAGLPPSTWLISLPNTNNNRWSGAVRQPAALLLSRLQQSLESWGEPTTESPRVPLRCGPCFSPFDITISQCYEEMSFQSARWGGRGRGDLAVAAAVFTAAHQSKHQKCCRRRG